jgi:hypothetical protein
MKPLIAAPPEVTVVNNKNVKAYYIPNIIGVIITTNYKEDGIYIDETDRRHDFLWSDCLATDFSNDYFEDLIAWRDKRGGLDAVIWELNNKDVSAFLPGAPPVWSEAKRELCAAHRSVALDGLCDAIDRLKNPSAFTMGQILFEADASFKDWHDDVKNRPQLPHIIAKAGYTKVLNKRDRSGRWKLAGKQTYIYALTGLKSEGRQKAAEKLKAKLDGAGQNQEDKNANASWDETIIPWPGPGKGH